jgi:CheY-like chemotaxis protein
VAECRPSNAVGWSPRLDPDLVIIDAALGRRSWPALCERLRADPRVSNQVPILILTTKPANPDERVAALHAGAWGFLPYAGLSGDPERLMLELHAYLQARRRATADDGNGFPDPTPGVFRRADLARRARELAALLTRQHAPIACLVFAWDRWTPGTVQAIAGAARVSDVVGILSPREVALVAPATTEPGVVRLAERLTQSSLARPPVTPAARGLNVGYEAVANLKYTPADPLDLLARAAVAASIGHGVPGYAWVRRLEPGTAAPSTPRSTTS